MPISKHPVFQNIFLALEIKESGKGIIQWPPNQVGPQKSLKEHHKQFDSLASTPPGHRLPDLDFFSAAKEDLMQPPCCWPQTIQPAHFLGGKLKIQRGEVIKHRFCLLEGLVYYLPHTFHFETPESFSEQNNEHPYTFHLDSLVLNILPHQLPLSIACLLLCLCFSSPSLKASWSKTGLL